MRIPGFAIRRQDACAARPFTARRRLPADLRVPPWIGATIAASVAGGLLLGGVPETERRLRVLRAVFFGAAFGYLTTSLVDFAEHFRLEKIAAGRYLRAVVVPLGESLNHGLTILTVISAIILTGPPLRTDARWRGLWVALAPGVFLALGWRDELVYHRRRTTHREDIIHTVAHLAAGMMWTALYAITARGARPISNRGRSRASAPCGAPGCHRS